MHSATHTAFAPRSTQPKLRLGSGWWLLPSVVMGAGIWIAAITAVIA